MHDDVLIKVKMRSLWRNNPSNLANLLTQAEEVVSYPAKDSTMLARSILVQRLG